MSGTEETSVYTNGINGVNGSVKKDNKFCANGDFNMDSFLFTSESVGEGHPGMDQMITTISTILTI